MIVAGMTATTTEHETEATQGRLKPAFFLTIVEVTYRAQSKQSARTGWVT
jgi:hypothetical protein